MVTQNKVVWLHPWSLHPSLQHEWGHGTHWQKAGKQHSGRSCRCVCPPIKTIPQSCGRTEPYLEGSKNSICVRNGYLTLYFLYTFCDLGTTSYTPKQTREITRDEHLASSCLRKFLEVTWCLWGDACCLSSATAVILWMDGFVCSLATDDARNPAAINRPEIIDGMEQCSVPSKC